MKVIIWVLGIIGLLILTGCGSTKTVSDQTTTTISEHYVTPPVVKDTGMAYWENTTPAMVPIIEQIHKDSSWAQVKVETTTPHGKVTYYPHNDSVIVEMQADPVKVTNTNTVQKVVQEQQPGFFASVWLWIKQSVMTIAIVGAIVLLILLFLKIKK